MAEGIGVLPVKSFDSWIGGVRLERAVTEYAETDAHMMVDTSTLDSELGETYKEIPDGNLRIDILFKANMELEEGSFCRCGQEKPGRGLCRL